LYVTWDKVKIEEFLKDKKERSLDINEYLLLIKFINKIRPDTIIDIGTYLGASGYILGTCCDSIKKVYSIDNIECPNYCEKDEAKREEHGKYLTSDMIFLKNGYENNLTNLIKSKNEFVFWDAGKNSEKVLNQIHMSHNLGIKYIALHDVNVKSVKRVINYIKDLYLYKIIEEDIESCPEKGVIIFEIME